MNRNAFSDGFCTPVILVSPSWLASIIWLLNEHDVILMFCCVLFGISLVVIAIGIVVVDVVVVVVVP